uniref:Spore protein YkvP/CgeB glycosyl transferase-like domain-containing protein n=1 Tax=Desulfobacca acetoxidans TaxID=60893 RepID=A0A7V4LBZ6_9BACT
MATHPASPPPVPRRVIIVVNLPKPPVGEGIARAFGRLGAETRIFMSHLENSRFDRYIIHHLNHLAHNLRILPKGVNWFEDHPLSHKEYRNRRFLELCREFKPDLVFLTRGLRFKLETLAALRELTTVFCWYTESEERFPEIAPELPFYHHTYFFSSRSLELARNLGYGNTSLLLHALDTDLFRPLGLPPKYDWCFVGQWHARRQEYLAGLARVSKNFVIYGPRWAKHTFTVPSLFFHLRGREIWGEALNRLYNQTRVVINVSVWGSAGTGANLRLLEVPACGACLLTDVARDASLLLTPEEDFVSAADLAEMQAKLAELLADDRRRQEVARRGCAKARSVRTYDHLVAEVAADWAACREGGT